MWQIKFSDQAFQFLEKADNNITKQILAGIKKVSQNPLPNPNGYGKPLGNKGNKNLTGFYKTKFRSLEIRVVYDADIL